MSDPAEHCWHGTGHGWSHGWGGSQEVVCCQCGIRGAREWTTRSRQIEGHGPHFTIDEQVYGDVVIQPAGGWAIVGSGTSEPTP